MSNRIDVYISNEICICDEWVLVFRIITSKNVPMEFS